MIIVKLMFHHSQHKTGRETPAQIRHIDQESLHLTRDLFIEPGFIGMGSNLQHENHHISLTSHVATHRNTIVEAATLSKLPTRRIAQMATGDCIGLLSLFI